MQTHMKEKPTFWSAPRHLVQPEYEEFLQFFSRFLTAAVGVTFRKPAVTLNAAGQLSELIWWSLIPQKHRIASQLPLGCGMFTFLLTKALCSELTHFCESSGIMGWSGSAAGAAAGTWRAYREWAANSQAASTGQHRLRSRSRPHASLTPPKSSAERSSRQVAAWVWAGNAGTVLVDAYSPGFNGWSWPDAGSASKPANERWKADTRITNVKIKVKGGIFKWKQKKWVFYSTGFWTLTLTFGFLLFVNLLPKWFFFQTADTGDIQSSSIF